MSTLLHTDFTMRSKRNATAPRRCLAWPRRRIVCALLCLAAFCRCAGANNTFHVIDASDGLTDNQIQHLLQLPDGRMAITTLSNINIFDGAGFHYIHKRERNFYQLPYYKGAYHVYVGRNQLLWVKNWHSLICLDLRQGRYIENLGRTFRQMGFDTPVNDIFLDSQHRVWAVGPKGIQCEGDKLAYPLPADAGNLQDMDVRDRNLFLFFETGEVVCYRTGSPHLICRQAAYPARKAGLYSGTSLVVSTKGGPFYQLRTGKRSVFLMFDPATARWSTLLEVPYTLHTLVLTPDRMAYVTCPHGYWRFDLHSGRKELIGSLTTDNGLQVSGVGLNTVFCDRQGGLWMGTYDRGVLYCSPNLYRFTSQPYGIRFPAPRPIGPNAGISLPTYKGKAYTCVLTDSRGWTWAGTPDGLCLFVPGQRTTRIFHADDGLPNNFVHALAQDARHNVWAATSNGISHIAVNSRTNRFVFTNYTTRDGTLKGEYRDNMASVLPDGSIQFCGVNGYTTFHPDSVKPYNTTLDPLLTDVSLFGERLVLGRSYDGRVLLTQAPAFTHSLELNHNQNALSFSFTSLNFAAPHQTFYRYRLAGIDSDWHVVQAGGENSLTDEKGLLHLSFLDLRPGSYQLLVMASTSSDRWNGKVYEVRFTIHAPWWATTTAFCIYFAIAALLLVTLVQIYLKQQKQRLIRRQKEQALLQRIQDLIRQTEPENTCQTDSGLTENVHSKTDAEFIRQASSLVEQHIGEQGYSVSQLSNDLCMERTGLYKKLTALLDESPTLFIRHIRLQKAAELILAGQLTIGEIAFRTGFSSASYLGKCFQDEFGCRPSEYARRTEKSQNLPSHADRNL